MTKIALRQSFGAAAIATLLLTNSPAHCNAFAQDRSAAPDNTKVNKRDRNKSEPTADQQKMNRTDREITRDIRKAVIADKSLSTYAHNIKIITQNGAVTLKGPVHSEDEKKNIEAKAASVLGSNDKINSQISVKQ